jgi:hypothetical protein|tara:strand:- start:3622 stop:3777 length:156 start_codon:yes stop_codon:yes gene_type:complete
MSYIEMIGVGLASKNKIKGIKHPKIKKNKTKKLNDLNTNDILGQLTEDDLP